ncbi:hypothetical protein BRADI_3g48770v3 [Brachypodium distachyon]|uniref:Leucine-rich repeat-containing N-terminal plant-type domain-containing protein n=2 Tax=Brachypodium distachyon TaxID=15368 RepID=A0A0Q3QEV6_BRADI|nr:hypothetical protein BRADI_3g48770v3 [Brachypodium distachyon]
MAKYVSASLAILLLTLSLVAATTADDPSHSELSSKISEHSLSYSPQAQHFPNERLYRAYLVIQRFKSSITSDPKNITTTWSGSDICGKTRYAGFHCAITPGRAKILTVTAIVFNGFGLRAPRLHSFIDQLPDVVIFQASSNNFGGDIPHLDGLEYMYKLSMYDDLHDQYSETKTTIGGNVGIGRLFQLTYKVGINFGHSNGRALLLNRNSLSGPLPANLGISKLSYLALANNKLTGPIPSSIGQAKDSLLELLLLNNQLSGCLPHELGMLTKTTVIDAGKNQLTGPIPQSFSCLSSVEQLNLGENRLYGQVPDALCKLGRLANLTLAGNYFSSVGPACSALVKDGVLDVKRNCIPGLANQRAPAECASFMSQPKASCPAASAPVSCPAEAAADAKKMAPEGRAAAKDYASYVTYATLHE